MDDSVASPTGRGALLAAVVESLAASGVGDLSLRSIASGVGTSHRMLIYHFGSRDGLLEAVVEALEDRERRLLSAIMSAPSAALAADGTSYWGHILETARHYGPLYFELSARAMHAAPGESVLGRVNHDRWVEALTHVWQAEGTPPEDARTRARLNLAVSRGLLHDYLLTGDRRAVDLAMADFTRLTLGDPH